MNISAVFAAAFLALAPLLSPAQAMAAEMGMAIVAGAEVGFGMCLGADKDDATQCAVKKCLEGGKDDPNVQCEPAAWCPAAGYGGIVTINNSEGFTYSEYPCDAADEAALTATMRDLCTKAYSEGANGCSVNAAWDPEGNEMDVTDAMQVTPAE